MALHHIISLMGGGFIEPGEALFTALSADANGVAWVVPADLFRISAVAVAPGQQGPGGALHWRNNIPVVPGETLRVVVGNGTYGSGSPAVRFSAIFRPPGPISDANALVWASGNQTKALVLGGGGQNGRPGVFPGQAGGAGGYAENDGSWGANGSGGPQSDGHGVGLYGRTPSPPGSSTPYVINSPPGPYYGGGLGEGQVCDNGAVRIIWGTGRLFPEIANAGP